MKGYVTKFLKEFQQLPPPKSVNGITLYTEAIYSKSAQYTPVEEERTRMDKKIRNVQEICIKLIYLSITVDNTIYIDLMNCELQKQRAHKQYTDH